MPDLQRRSQILELRRTRNSSIFFGFLRGVVAGAGCASHGGVQPCGNPDYRHPNLKPAEEEERVVYNSTAEAEPMGGYPKPSIFSNCWTVAAEPGGYPKRALLPKTEAELAACDAMAADCLNADVAAGLDGAEAACDGADCGNADDGAPSHTRTDPIPNKQVQLQSKLHLYSECPHNCLRQRNTRHADRIREHKRILREQA